MKLKSKKRYKITIEDESHLIELAGMRFSTAGLWISLVSLLLLLLVISSLIVSLTPIRTLLPGYLKESQRSATEEGLLRLDSLMTAYDVKQAYIENYLRVTDTNRQPDDSAAVVPASRELTSDSLSEASALEKKFVSQMEEKERFNISVLAPLAADGVMFSPVTADGVFAVGSRHTESPEILLSADENIQSSADGTVIALYHSSTDRGYVIVVQHSRGFVTSFNGVGTPLVGLGDNVNAGQMIALSPKPDAKGRRKMTVRMWHNGLALKPYDYIGLPSRHHDGLGESFESPRGR